MKLSRENFRAMIYYDFKSKLSVEETLQRLVCAFGSEAPCKSSVYAWFRDFKLGRVLLEDEKKPGRPKAVTLPENIEAVRSLIEKDRPVTYREIASELGISMTSINKILHKHLKVRKLCARWIPHLLTEEEKRTRVLWCTNMIAKFHGGASKSVFNILTSDESWIYQYDPETKLQSTVWVFQNEDPPTKVARSRSIGKQMVANFFSITGHVVTVPLIQQRTVTSQWYTTIGLTTALQEVRKNNPNRRVILHHDNASAHTGKLTLAYLNNENVELMTHPPYSPDLAPNDYFLFPKIKEKLRGHRFTSPEAAVEAFKMHASELSTLEYQNCFKKWFERMEKCIKHQGEYFEKK